MARLRSAFLIFVCGALVTACGSAGRPSVESVDQAVALQAPSTPVQTALAWFRAIDAKDRPAVLASFASGFASSTSWHYWGVDAWPTFSSVRCKPGTETARRATVLCTFSESQASSVGNPAGFWSISFLRDVHGRWLIVNYGQG